MKETTTKGPSYGQGPGGSPNDMGTQDGGPDMGGSDESLESKMVKNNTRWVPGNEKEQGFDVTKGTV